MLGVERAIDMLRGTAQCSAQSYQELPNSSAFFTKAMGEELVFFKEQSGVNAQDLTVSARTGAWTMKLTKFQLAKGFPGLEHARISCARARQDGFVLTGHILYSIIDILRLSPHLPCRKSIPDVWE